MARADLGTRTAAALVFFSSAAVLVVELVALRLLAPYLGLTLETSTLVIGIALAAIAAGSWAGGWYADLVDPRRVLGPLLGASGAVVAVTPFVVRGTGEAASGSGSGVVLLVAAVTILVPGAMLSAVTPMVTKLQLLSLDRTGTVVGRLSGIGTVGAIFGTVVTGFVLVSRLAVSTILLALGVLLLLAAVAVELLLRGRVGRGSGAAAAVVALGGLAALTGPGGCDAETTYHCADVVADPARESGRTLVLDGLRHSYVDLDDPRHLEFAYVRAIASVSDVAFAPEAPLRAYHLGGGGLTLPRYLAVHRPGTDSVVSEIDPGVVRVDRERLGLGDAVADVRVEDGRLGIARLEGASRDLVVGDAFGGVSVPWHLTTREAIAQVERVLDEDGVYVANLIDFGELAFARAEVATLREAFEHVAVLGEPDDLDPAALGRGGNLVALASNRRVDLAALQDRLTERRTGWRVLAGPGLEGWVGEATVLTDDYAPVDQLLQPFATQ